MLRLQEIDVVPWRLLPLCGQEVHEGTAPARQRTMGLGPERVSRVLVLYGVAVIVGNAIGGRLVHRDPVPLLAVMFTLQAAVLIALSFTASSAPGNVVTLALMGALSFCNVSGLHGYVLQLTRRYRPGGIDTASTLNITAANLGVASAALIGDWVEDSPLGLAATPWVGACVVGVALVPTLWSGWLDRREAENATGDRLEWQGGGHGH